MICWLHRVVQNRWRFGTGQWGINLSDAQERRFFLFRHSCESIRTIPCDYALCCMFLPGDHLILIGCKVREFISRILFDGEGIFWFRMVHCKSPRSIPHQLWKLFKDMRKIIRFGRCVWHPIEWDQRRWGGWAFRSFFLAARFSHRWER